MGVITNVHHLVAFYFNFSLLLTRYSALWIIILNVVTSKHSWPGTESPGHPALIVVLILSSNEQCIITWNSWFPKPMFFKHQFHEIKISKREPSVSKMILFKMTAGWKTPYCTTRWQVFRVPYFGCSLSCLLCPALGTRWTPEARPQTSDIAATPFGC